MEGFWDFSVLAAQGMVLCFLAFSSLREIWEWILAPQAQNFPAALRAGNANLAQLDVPTELRRLPQAAPKLPKLSSRAQLTLVSNGAPNSS